MTSETRHSQEARRPLLDVWTFDLSAPRAEVERLTTLLSQDERERGSRFVRPDHADWFYVAHGRLREILSSYLGVPPADIVFARDSHAKPRIASPATDIAFNLSHSGAVAAAVVATAEVGIDLEFVKELDNPAEIEGALAPGEQQALATLEGRARLEAFYRCWTRKEAVIKGIGSGLGTPLESFEVWVTSEPEANVSLDLAGTMSPASWHVVSFEARPAFVGAVAIPRDPTMDRTAIRWRTWPEAG